MDSRKDILDAKEKLDHLLGRTVSIDEKFAALDAKQSSIDDAEYRINALNNVMADIHVNLQSFKQQKEVIDHIGDKLMRLDFALKRAEVLTKELHEERELARRIYQNIRALRTSRPKAAVAQLQPRSAAGTTKDVLEKGKELENSRTREWDMRTASASDKSSRRRHQDLLSAVTSAKSNRRLLPGIRLLHLPRP